MRQHTWADYSFDNINRQKISNGIDTPEFKVCNPTDIHDMLMQWKSAVESDAQVPKWRAEFNTSAINIHEFWKMLQVKNLFSSNE